MVRYSVPLHTRAKSRDHEIARAQKKMSKGCPRHTSKIMQTWSRILECSVKSYQSRPSTKCNFNEFLLMRVLTRFWAFGVPWSPGFVLSLPPRLQETVFEDIPSDHEPWTMIQLMPCRNPCRLYIHLPFTYSVCPSSVVWSEIGPAPPFSPMRVLVV